MLGNEAGDGSWQDGLVEQEQHFVDEVGAHGDELVGLEKKNRD